MADEIFTELKALIRRHVAMTILAISAFLMIVAIDAYAIKTVVTRFDNLQNNICVASTQATKGNPEQYRYWTAAALRAETRAAAEDPALAAIDTDAAKSDTDIARVFAPPKTPYIFPGCPAP
jgi:hypothetical protein